MRDNRRRIVFLVLALSPFGVFASKCQDYFKSLHEFTRTTTASHLLRSYFAGAPVNITFKPNTEILRGRSHPEAITHPGWISDLDEDLFRFNTKNNMALIVRYEDVQDIDRAEDAYVLSQREVKPLRVAFKLRPSSEKLPLLGRGVVKGKITHRVGGDYFFHNDATGYSHPLGFEDIDLSTLDFRGSSRDP